MSENNARDQVSARLSALQDAWKEFTDRCVLAGEDQRLLKSEIRRVVRAATDMYEGVVDADDWLPSPPESAVLSDVETDVGAVDGGRGETRIDVDFVEKQLWVTVDGVSQVASFPSDRRLGCLDVAALFYSTSDRPDRVWLLEFGATLDEWDRPTTLRFIQVNALIPDRTYIKWTYSVEQHLQRGDAYLSNGDVDWLSLSGGDDDIRSLDGHLDYCVKKAVELGYALNGPWLIWEHMGAKGAARMMEARMACVDRPIPKSWEPSWQPATAHGSTNHRPPPPPTPRKRVPRKAIPPTMRKPRE